MMKRLFIFLIFLFVQYNFAQQIKEVEMCDLKFEINIDSTAMIVSKNGRILSGTYKISGVLPEQYSFTEFIEGKSEGKSTTIYKGITIREKYFENGLPNGLWIEYDDSGKMVMRKSPYINGNLHGIGWFNGKEIYYWNGKRIPKQTYDQNIISKKKE